MITLRRTLPWAGALALGVLGWFAMVPIWTQGLGLSTPAADFQPALWLAAANVMMVLGGGVILLRVGVAAAFRGAGGFEPIMRPALVLGVGLYLAACVLFVAMIGQPLRMWFLITQWDWGNPLCRGILGFALCLLSFFFGSNRGISNFVVAFSSLGAFILLALQLSPGLPVAHGHIVTPSLQDWLVLAFALGCGAYASWLRARGISK